MGPGTTEETSRGPSSAVRAYITQEWTSQGYHCRSENVNQGIFEVVLPQVAPNFSLFMADLLDCGVSSVDFRADAHECRLIVAVGEASVLPDFVQSSLGKAKWRNNVFVAIFVIFLICFLVWQNQHLALVATKGEL